MYELDKERVGKFIAELRKEKGMTQKELAEQLKVSDKTVSKWETANGMPDVSMLMPIADLFGVTVTELLQGQRMLQTEKMNVGDVDALLKQTLQLTEEENQSEEADKQKGAIIYIVCAVICVIEVLVLFALKGWTGIGICMPTFVLLSVFFGGYFTFVVKRKLPAYYDENKISFYTDGFMKLSVPGMYINNRNWPHVVKAAQWGTNVLMVGYPLFRFVLVLLLYERMGDSTDMVELAVGMLIFFGLLFIPLVVAAKKNQ